ncbi:MAG: serine hydrolase, partial [Natronospirillum sp.]
QALQEARERFGQFDRIHSVVAAHQGEVFFEETWGGPGPRVPVNIKSVSKTILSALVGNAIERGLIRDVDQPITELLANLPPNANPRLNEITVGNLLSMQAGLERTSGSNYGRWVVSNDWVGFVLSRPFVAEPGGERLYSTGSSHLLSAILTDVSGRSTHELAVEWLSLPLNVSIPPWPRDPQGIFFGGNDMVLSPYAMLRFGEAYRQGGALEGKRIVTKRWIDASWEGRGNSRWTGDAYGYGWFITEIAGEVTYYARGFGGQLIYVIPAREMTVVITSSPNPPSPGGRYARELTEVVEDTLIRAIHN